MSVVELLDRAQELGATFTVPGPGRLHVSASDPLPNDLPRYGLFEPEYVPEFDHGYHFVMDIETLLPEGFTPVEAHVTTMMPGTILESRELSSDPPLNYQLDVNALGAEVPNLDWENGLADLLTTSIYVEAEDPSGNRVHLGRVINFHGAEIFNLDVPVPEEEPFHTGGPMTCQEKCSSVRSVASICR